MRIGVNAGSLEREFAMKYGFPCPPAMVDSALRYIEIGESEGMFVCPEGAATWSAAKNLAAGGKLDRRSRIMLFNTGTGFKYV